MTTEFTWKIDNVLVLQEPQPNYIVEIGFTLTGKDGVIKESSVGRVAFDPANPSEQFVIFEELEERTLIQWVKNVLTEEGVSSQEAIVQSKIDQIVSPPIVPQSVELPWKANLFTVQI
jgi:hypothetical protein